LGNWLIGLLNYIIKGLGSVLTVIFSILPSSPFKYLDNSPIKDYLGIINYFIPLDFIISTGETWLTAIGIYYIYQIVLRWIKADD
jgi:hypothetical protein